MSAKLSIVKGIFRKNPGFTNDQVKDAFEAQTGETVGDTTVREARKILSTEPTAQPKTEEPDYEAKQDEYEASLEDEDEFSEEDYEQSIAEDGDPEDFEDTDAEVVEDDDAEYPFEEGDAEPLPDEPAATGSTIAGVSADGNLVVIAQTSHHDITETTETVTPTYGEPQTSEQHARFYGPKTEAEAAGEDAPKPEATETEEAAEKPAKTPKPKGYTATHGTGTKSDSSKRCEHPTSSGPCIRPLNHPHGHMSAAVRDRKIEANKIKDAQKILSDVKAAIKERYEEGAWSIFIEAYSDSELLEAIAGSKTVKGAMTRLAKIEELKNEQAAATQQ